MNTRHLFATLIILSLLLARPALQPARAVCAISGTVYRDFNANGTRAAPLEAGVGGVTVNAYDPAGAVVATANTDLFGNYSLTGIPDSIEVRLEVVVPQAFLRNGPVGGDSNTSVRFVQCGVGSTFNSINFSVHNPAQHCQANPPLVTNSYRFGDQIAGPNANTEVVISFPYNSGTTAAPGSITSAPQPGGAFINGAYTINARANQVGSVWGSSYQNYSDTVYTASFLRRHVSLGPTANPGTIYRIDRRLALPNASVFVTLPAGTIDPVARAANPLSGAGELPYFDDIPAFNAVGYIGLGDIDIADDGNTLYAINLFDSQLYALTLGIPAGAAPLAVSSVPLPTGLPGATVGCPVGFVRPGALKFFDGVLYIGLTCIGPTQTDLRAYVYSFTGAFSAAPVAEFSLNYPRGCVTRTGPCGPAPGDSPATWLPWVTDTNGNPSDDLTPGIFGQVYRPQPWLLDIEFDEFGFMVLAVADRTGFQTGNTRGLANSGPVEGVSGGDLLRLAPGGGVWTLENNASSGVGLPGGATTLGAGTNQGPGGGEFYFQERYSFTHDEITLPGLTQVYGTGQIVTTVFDPSMDGQFRNGGVTMSTHATGGRARSIEIFQQDAVGTFGKAAGMGDVEGLCNLPPLEIGNRIWLDTTLNGIQDGGETPLGGVFVDLFLDINGDGDFDDAGERIAQVQTTAAGEYIFNETTIQAFMTANGIAPIPNVHFFDINNDGIRQPGEPFGVLAGRNYQIRLSDAANFAPGGPLENLFATGAVTGGDVRDSNGVVPAPGSVVSLANIPTWTLTTGPYGDNNHTYDFGFSTTQPPIIPTATPVPTAAPGGGSTGGGTTAGGGSVLTSPAGDIVSPANLLVTKTANPPFAQPGTVVTWTITVTNPTSSAFSNVTFTDVMPPEVEVLSATATSGTVTINGQNVVFSQASLAPGATVTVTAVTRIRANTAVPFIIRNQLGAAVATVVSVNVLPSTGEIPPLVIAGVGAGLVGIVFLWLRRRAHRASGQGA